MSRVNWPPPRTIVARTFLKILFWGCPIIHSLSNGAMLERPVNANEPGFLYTRCGTSSSSYSGMSSGWPARWSFVLVHLLVLRVTAGPKLTLQLLRFCVSLISVSLFGRFSFLEVYGVVEVLIYEVSVRILFASCDSQSIVCSRKLNCGREYCQFEFKLCVVGATQNFSTFRVLPRTR